MPYRSLIQYHIFHPTSYTRGNDKYIKIIRQPVSRHNTEYFRYIIYGGTNQKRINRNEKIIQKFRITFFYTELILKYLNLKINKIICRILLYLNIL